MMFKLNAPISEDMFDKIMDKNGDIVVYRFRGDKVASTGLSEEAMCEYWYIRANMRDVVEMFYNEVPINVSAGRQNENTHKSSSEILKFVNKMVEASKTDKTIAVYVRNVTQQMLKARRPPTPARKAKKTTPKRK